jgi:hypothetical protein
MQAPHVDIVHLVPWKSAARRQLEELIAAPSATVTRAPNPSGALTG